jgi:hypothetical protein
MLDFFVEDIEDVTGVNCAPQFQKKGADILFITPSGDVFADPGTYTCQGYLILFKYLKEKYGLDVTWSTYASEGGNFGFFTSHETMKRLNAKMYMPKPNAWGQMDSWRRVRPYVAGHSPVHGHHERPCRLHGSTEEPDHRNGSRMPLQPRWFTLPSSPPT